MGGDSSGGDEDEFVDSSRIFQGVGCKENEEAEEERQERLDLGGRYD